MLGQFLTVVGGDKIDCLVADREFIGATWFAWLRANHIPLCIRTRHAGLADNRSLITGAQLLQKSSPFDLVFLDRPASRLRLLALGNRSALVLWGLFDRGVKSSGHRALEMDKQRWQIEVLFEALKSRGFNPESSSGQAFEETRLRDAKRLETLCGVLAIAFCWAYHVGAWRHRLKAIPLKTHQRAAKSLFRHGFDGIRQAPSLMRQTSGSSLSRACPGPDPGSSACSGRCSLRPKRFSIHPTLHNFVVYSDRDVPLHRVGKEGLSYWRRGQPLSPSSSHCGNLTGRCWSLTHMCVVVPEARSCSCRVTS